MKKTNAAPGAFSKLSRQLFGTVDEVSEPEILARSKWPNWTFLERVDSTNAIARRVVRGFAEEGDEPPRSAFLAYEQTGGRGRGDHRWASPPGQGVYCSFVLPSVARGELATLPLLAAVGLARGLTPFLESPVRIKWPNDLMVRGGKIGGVLIETASIPEKPPVAIIGFGVNWGQDSNEIRRLPEGATSVRLEARGEVELGELVMALARAVAAELEHRGDLEYAGREYAELSAHATGDAMTCRLGDDCVHGSFAGFTAEGHLRLDRPEGEVTLAAGELTAGDPETELQA